MPELMHIRFSPSGQAKLLFFENPHRCSDDSSADDPALYRKCSVYLAEL